ncbi:MAG: hypothetical protein LBT17_00795 [Mycoplasmataceae bacterium]|nr:hypothetical protein [Mycoplasmataceae bacterium]
MNTHDMELKDVPGYKSLEERFPPKMKSGRWLWFRLEADAFVEVNNGRSYLVTIKDKEDGRYRFFVPKKLVLDDKTKGMKRLRFNSEYTFTLQHTWDPKKHPDKKYDEVVKYASGDWAKKTHEVTGWAILAILNMSKTKEETQKINDFVLEPKAENYWKPGEGDRISKRRETELVKAEEEWAEHKKQQKNIRMS